MTFRRLARARRPRQTAAIRRAGGPGGRNGAVSFAEYWVCPACKSLNRDRSRQCYSCHTDRPADAMGGAAGAPAPATDTARPTWGINAAQVPPSTAPAAAPSLTLNALASSAIPNAGAQGIAAATPATGSAAGLAPGGVFSAGSVLTGTPRPAPASPAGPINLVGGLIGGVAGAMIATLVWFGFVALTRFEVGLVAIAVGAVVGYGVVLGAGGRASFALIPISLVLTLAALLASEYLIVLRIGNEVAAQYGVTLDSAISTDPVTLISLGIRGDPLSLVFWAIAMFEAFVIPWRRIMNPR